MGDKAAEDQLVEYVRTRVAREPDYALHVFRVIWDRQQPREKYHHEYAGSDGRGFWEGDTPFFNGMHDNLEDRGFRPTRGEREILQDRMPRYARQYVKDCEERGVSVYSRGPKPPGDVLPAKVNKHPVKRKGGMPEAERKRILSMFRE